MIGEKNKPEQFQNTSVNAKDKDKDKEFFSVLDEKIKMEYQSAEILREVALLFGKRGDIKTAQALMQQAVIQSLEEPFIQKKLIEYNKLIEKN